MGGKADCVVDLIQLDCMAIMQKRLYFQAAGVWFMVHDFFFFCWE